MGKGRRQSALLMEIMIAVLFFALSASVILEVFAAAHGQSQYAEHVNAALAEGENVGTLLRASDDAEATLKEEGFEEREGVWTREEDGYTLTVRLEEEALASGSMQTALIGAVSGEEELLTLKSARYIPEEAAE